MDVQYRNSSSEVAISCPAQVCIFSVAPVALAGMMTFLLSISADVFGSQIALLQLLTVGAIGLALAVAELATVACLWRASMYFVNDK